ncbi:MAG TPA: iron ABC transporter permease [Acidimicrobiia bacterium]|nr:iron ABC transporter permease [Acidimicrobiia bacterium]
MTEVRAVAPRRALNPWPILIVAVAALVILPVAVMVSEALTPEMDVWRHLWETRLSEMLTSTVALLVLVSIGTLFLGVSMAWLVSAYRFPGRSVFRVALVLPLAMPGYILGYIFLTTFSYAGPVQSTLRDWFNTSDVWFPNVISLPGAALVLSLVLYPYVYVMMLTALREQGLRTWQVSRTLGHGRLRGAWRAVLPAARPTLAAGVALVMMEVLTDFATVQYFNVETLPVGIYRVWKGEGNRLAATQLAVLVLVFALAVIVLERVLRGRARFYQAGAKGFLEPVVLRGARRWLATGSCLAVLSAAFFLPVWRLITWTKIGSGVTVEGYIEHMVRTLTLAGLAAGSCLVVGGFVTAAGRLTRGRAGRWASKAILVGYTLPGTVIALGVLTTFSSVGRVVLVTTSLLGVVYAYVVRFVPLTTVAIDASLEKVTPSVVMAARTLGARPGRILRRIHLPMLRSGAAAALLLVFVHTLQEISIVLLLRPFTADGGSYDTLAVWVFNLTQNSIWEETGLPALTIIAVALIPVILMLRAGAGDKEPSHWERALAEPTAVPTTAAVG